MLVHLNDVYRSGFNRPDKSVFQATFTCDCPNKPYFLLLTPFSGTDTMKMLYFLTIIAQSSKSWKGLMNYE